MEGMSYPTASPNTSNCRTISLMAALCLMTVRQHRLKNTIPLALATVLVATSTQAGTTLPPSVLVTIARCHRPGHSARLLPSSIQHGTPQTSATIHLSTITSDKYAATNARSNGRTVKFRAPISDSVSLTGCQSTLGQSALYISAPASSMLPGSLLGSPRHLSPAIYTLWSETQGCVQRSRRSAAG